MYNSRPNAPFKPPRLIRKADSSDSAASSRPSSSSGTNNSQVSSPRANGSETHSSVTINSTTIAVPTLNPKPSNRIRKFSTPFIATPSLKKQKVVEEEEPSEDQLTVTTEKYSVQWRKRTNKKNKTWDGDGYASITYINRTNTVLVLKDSDGKQLSKKTFNVLPKLDDEIAIGGFELSLDEKLSTSDGPKTSLAQNTFQVVATAPTRPTIPIRTVERSSSPATVTANFKKVAPENYTETSGFRKSLYEGNPDSIVLPDPPHLSDFIKVSIDPLLSSKLRPHQIEGVKFMYECLLGYRDYKGTGCLLADEMGLGKTLMTITTIWTLLKQNPFPKENQPLVKKVLIVCPVTLINNWRSEFRKWLGLNRINILTLGNTSNEKQEILSFGKLHVYQVLIINYEKVSAHFQELSTINFDLLICDEGHRLKNSSNKVLNHLIKLSIPRKVVLTGTPIQNYLVEFHTLISFLNPGILPELKVFQRKFINPILRARDINCFDSEVKRQGEEISNQLIELTKKFILRRTQGILDNYLTTKTDILLFVPPTEQQLKLFQFISKLIKESYSNSVAFTLINLYKKICNSPSLLSEDDYFNNNILANNRPFFNSNNLLTTASGKINILVPLLLEMVAMNEKIVLISNYTKTLDLLETVIRKLNLTFLRLDGSTANNLRNKLVNQFNKSTQIQIFLLSSKSGGMGINLVGASRLILFDNDWNPSNDLQSMSRIHRDGQLKPCFIYRIFTTGCIDEKIFQRQLVKNKLSDKFLDDDNSAKSDGFDYQDLKNLFEVDTGTSSNTHDLLECECGGDGTATTESEEEQDDDDVQENSQPLNSQFYVTARELQENIEENGGDLFNKRSIKFALNDYHHYDPRVISQLEFDPVLNKIVNNKSFDDNTKLPISFIMSRVSNEQKQITDIEAEESEKEN
ncbi:DNA repair and recombination protein RDH54 [Spathaspora sp. JA1]|nr:DNA repair and recombination protein RDH54 [Spathaspora sp. JA1]